MNYNKHRKGGALGYNFAYLANSTLLRSMIFSTKKRLGKIQSDWVAEGWFTAFSPIAPPSPSTAN
jgi:hypothetical protein